MDRTVSGFTIVETPWSALLPSFFPQLSETNPFRSTERDALAEPATQNLILSREILVSQQNLLAHPARNQSERFDGLHDDNNHQRPDGLKNTITGTRRR